MTSEKVKTKADLLFADAAVASLEAEKNTAGKIQKDANKKQASSKSQR